MCNDIPFGPWYLSSVSISPLAEQLRPTKWEEMVNLSTLEPKLLEQLRSQSLRIPSVILWGPPGSGKTTLARLIGRTTGLPFRQLSAVLSGVKEVREVIAEAEEKDTSVVLMIDEIHRFNRSQQDALLPHVESGRVVLIGATTENPSFAVTGALLSRCRVVTFGAHSAEDLIIILQRASERLGVSIDDDARTMLLQYAGGDARKLLGALEAVLEQSGKAITAREVQGSFQKERELQYDRSGEEHYNVVSAFIKSLRGSQPDAALYWGFRMIEAGEDPRFVMRRMMIFASEDIGNADPRALQIAVATADAFERLGFPEGKIPLAQCITYLATAPKSNRSYLAMHAAIAAVKKYPASDVPKHLRNAPTELMKNLGYHDGYAYPHDTPEGFAPGVKYLPDKVKEDEFYTPTDRGYEKTIGERMTWWRSLRK